MTGVTELVPIGYSMSQLVDKTGVPAATVRYYLAVGLLPPPERVASNRFLYNDRHVELVRLVRLLRERRGLSLETIGKLLPELVPDLVGTDATGVFRTDMWTDLIGMRAREHLGRPVVERLVNAGLEAFCEHGFAEVSIDDVCRRAEIAKGSFYRHFASKESLFYAVCALVADRVRVDLADADATPRPSVARADALLPYASVIFDLASLASRERQGSSEALEALLGSLRGGLSVELGCEMDPPVEDDLANHRLGKALVFVLDDLARAKGAGDVAFH